MRIVRIRSRLHPRGHAYPLLEPDALEPAQLQELVAIHRRAAALRARRFASFTARRRIREALARAVSIIAPDIEPLVLRGLGDDECVAVLELWTTARGAV